MVASTIRLLHFLFRKMSEDLIYDIDDRDDDNDADLKYIHF
jgi:hypothetical protein